MDANLPPPMVSTGFLPTGSLLESLIHISNEVMSMERNAFVQVKNASAMIRRIKLLSSLYEEIQETNTPLPPSSILCLTELFSVVQRGKLLIQGCQEGSVLWSLVQTETISSQFQGIVNEIGRALDILPLTLLNLTADTKEQVELLHKQAKRVELFVDNREIQRREEIFQLMAITNEKTEKEKGYLDYRKINEVFSGIGLATSFDYDQEISKLRAESEKQKGTGGLIVVSNINNLTSLLSSVKSMLFNDDETDKTNHDSRQTTTSFSNYHSSPCSSYSQLIFSNIPDEFRCPISLDLMRDPVIIASGHTYNRNSIAQWINSGHQTCPKTGKRLIHMALIPNYALKSLIHQWCQENNVPLIEATSPSSSKTNYTKRKSMEEEVNHVSATDTAISAVKMTAEFLVGKLATGSTDEQRQAAYEIRLLAKTGMEDRRIIAEAGAIPFLVAFLGSDDPRNQENSVTALLNLSIYENNKVLIMSAAGAIDGVIDVLQTGKTTEARENAAATIFSLSMIHDYKAVIGAHPRAVPALVRLLSDGTAAGKKDAVTALFNLAVCGENKRNVVVWGAIPLLIEILINDQAGITDDALGVLALLLGCSEGLEEMRKCRVLVPCLIDLLRFRSGKGKEHSITILLGLCKDGGDEVARRLLLNPWSVPALQGLAADGSSKARRKADALLRLLKRFCVQTHTPVG
ncbi:U-box domain-containing protein 1-like [Rhododendron vialii]|uniref:U-box domain-containing protein 1-like n=1 Tax=Rhododendron vialii TaxID=182163 RepID=UPI00266047A8|nr:U-box domain-containing protein 1-like [Rhododendron vialii]